jgi:hypothetical protein
MLDLINRVQMFQIAAAKANHSLATKHKEPVFKLKFAEQRTVNDQSTEEH